MADKVTVAGSVCGRNHSQVVRQRRQSQLLLHIVDTTNRDRSLHFRKLCQRAFYAALPQNHALAQQPFLQPQDLATESQVDFHSDSVSAFGQWASGFEGEDKILCTVNTAQAALDLVAAGVGISILSEDCVRPYDQIHFVPVQNWHQALYMCILYDKWLEPPVWGFVDNLVKQLRHLYPHTT